MEWPVLVLAAVIALAALGLAFTVDRRRARLRRQTLAAPAPNPVLDHLAAPTYLTPDQIRAQRDPKARALTEAARRATSTRLAGLAPLPGGWASSDFVTDPASGWAVAEAPVVLVAEAVTRLADLAPAIALARQRQTGLAVVVGRINPEALAELALNAVAGRLNTLVVQGRDLAQYARAANAHLVCEADLSAGYLPAPALGTCRLWVSDSAHTWIDPTPLTP
jgi:hypothetical protein